MRTPPDKILTTLNKVHTRSPAEKGANKGLVERTERQV